MTGSAEIGIALEEERRKIYSFMAANKADRME